MPATRAGVLRKAASAAWTARASTMRPPPPREVPVQRLAAVGEEVLEAPVEGFVSPHGGAQLEREEPGESRFPQRVERVAPRDRAAAGDEVLVALAAVVRRVHVDEPPGRGAD